MRFITLSFIAFLCSSHIFAGDFTDLSDINIGIGSRICTTIRIMGIKRLVLGTVENILADTDSLDIRYNETSGGTLDRKDIDLNNVLTIGNRLDDLTMNDRSITIRQMLEHYPDAVVTGVRLKHRARIRTKILGKTIRLNVYDHNDRHFHSLDSTIPRLNRLSEGDQVQFKILLAKVTGEVIAIIDEDRVVVKFCKLNFWRKASELTRVED